MPKKPADPTQSQIEDFEKLQIITHEAELAAETQFKSKLLNIYNEAAQDKEKYSLNWRQYMDFLRGRQWPERRPSYKISAVVNFMIENIERKTALLTDARPIPKVRARSDEAQDTADILNTMLSLIFESSNYSQARAELVENAQVLGLGSLATLYNPDANVKTGDISVVSYDPRALYFDPLVRKSYLLAEGEYVIVEDVWSLEKAKDIFPKRADMYTPSAGLNRYINQRDNGFFASIKNRVFKPREDKIAISEIPRVYVREFWLRDRSKNSSGAYRFDNASRKVVMVGEIIADDGPNPYNDGDFPIDLFGWHTDFDSAWSWGDVELLKNPQELMNKIIATVLENIALMSNAIWIGDQDALTKEEWIRLNNAPGSYVKKRPGRELRREPGVPLPTYVLDTLGKLEISSEKITGMVDVVRGITSGQVASGVGIESLQMMAQALIRLRARSLEAVHERVGRKLISRIFQYYRPDKIFEVLRETKDIDPKTIESIVSELLKPISKRKAEAWTDIAFSIEPWSSLGLAQSQRRIESMRLYELKAIDDQALLDDLEYPHRNEVLKRMQSKREVEQTAETAAQPGGVVSRFPHQAGASPQGRF